MSRLLDAVMIADQVLHVAHYTRATADQSAAILASFRQCTHGLTEYEQQQVAYLVNFRLSRSVL